MQNSPASAGENKIFIQWDNRYAIGIPLIDNQHKELIRLTNELYEGCLMGKEEAKHYFMKTVKGTVDYVKYHFTAEEKLLETVKYPELPEHKKQHESFIKQLLDDVQSFESGKKFVPNLFVRFLRDWILSHIAVMDKKYADYILDLKKQGVLSSTIGL
jgi:hemerythrin